MKYFSLLLFSCLFSLQTTVLIAAESGPAKNNNTTTTVFTLQNIPSGSRLLCSLEKVVLPVSYVKVGAVEFCDNDLSLENPLEINFNLQAIAIELPKNNSVVFKIEPNHENKTVTITATKKN